MRCVNRSTLLVKGGRSGERWEFPPPPLRPQPSQDCLRRLVYKRTSRRRREIVSARLSQTVSDCYALSKIVSDILRQSQAVSVCLRLSQTVSDCLRLFRISSDVIINVDRFRTIYSSFFPFEFQLASSSCPSQLAMAGAQTAVASRLPF